MKLLVKMVLISAVAAIMISSCKKDEIKAVLHTGSAPTLTPSATSLTLDSANASTTEAINFKWGAVNYGASVAVNYTLQIDSINDNFIKPISIPLGDSLSVSYTVADFNNMVLSLGLIPDSVGQVHARIQADVVTINNAPQNVSSVFSAPVVLSVVPYSTKPQPKYPVPANLYLVGDASAGGWNNPVPVPSQQFTKINDYTFGMITYLTGGKQYLLIPVNGDWSHKYAVESNTDPSLKSGGAFVPDAPNNMPGPDASGLYEIIVDFVKGTYTVTPATAGTVPANLYIVGDATAGGWNNPVPLPSQQFTQVSNAEFQITIPLIGGKSYLFLPVNGDWSHKYGGTSKTGGTLLMDGSVPGSNTPAPDADGTYLIDVNFLAKTYTVTQQ